ncbi:MAG: hypothetical protein PUP92_08310 [Rhizonema sp. PD38]|nr:hypothetical protein [Rhizonema sp. PD38]
MNLPVDSLSTTHNAVLSTATVEVTASNELTLEEQRERLHLERTIERSFYEAGKALKTLREHKLFRSTHSTFEEYCKERFGFERRHPYRLIDAADVVDNLVHMCPIGTQNELETNSFTICSNRTQILPTNERQVRPLTKLEPRKQWEVWQIAVEEAGNKVPSSNIVKDIVQRIRERTKVPNSYQVGEVCQFIPKDNPELRGKTGCWCIVTSIGDYSCTVETWDAEYVLKLEHLKSLDYLEVECAFMQQLCLRLKKLHSLGNLDTAAYWVLNGLSKLSTPYLTPLQEKLLSVLEQEYAMPWATTAVVTL